MAAGTPWWRRRAARRRTRCGTTTSARTRWWSSRTARINRTWSPARSAAPNARNGGNARSPRIRRTPSTSRRPRVRYRCSCWSLRPGSNAAPRLPLSAGTLAVDGAHARDDRAHDAEVAHSRPRARLEVVGGVRPVVLPWRVNLQQRGRVHGVASRFGGHRDVVVGQHRVRGRAGREDHSVRGRRSLPVGWAAELVTVHVDGRDAGKAEQRAGVPAQVGELQRVENRPGRPVTLPDRHPDAQAEGGARGDGGRRGARAARGGRREGGGGHDEPGGGDAGGDRGYPAGGDGKVIHECRPVGCGSAVTESFAVKTGNDR